MENPYAAPATDAATCYGHHRWPLRPDYSSIWFVIVVGVMWFSWQAGFLPLWCSVGLTIVIVIGLVVFAIACPSEAIPVWRVELDDMVQPTAHGQLAIERFMLGDVIEYRGVFLVLLDEYRALAASAVPESVDARQARESVDHVRHIVDELCAAAQGLRPLLDQRELSISLVTQCGPLGRELWRTEQGKLVQVK